MGDKPDILKANKDMLNNLHSMVAQHLIKKIQSGEATVQEISAAIKYLKDNDITADVEFNQPLRQLEQEVTPVGQLPFVDDEEDTCGTCETPCGNEHCVTKEKSNAVNS
jgi:hypothetical protein